VHEKQIFYGRKFIRVCCLMLFQNVYTVTPRISLQIVTYIGSSISVLALLVSILLLLIPRFENNLNVYGIYLKSLEYNSSIVTKLITSATIQFLVVV